MMVQGQPEQKATKTPSQPRSQAWWYKPEISATQETLSRRLAWTKTQDPI
jgi:hypothetical protein